MNNDWLTQPMKDPLPFDKDFLQYLTWKKIPMDLTFNFRMNKIPTPMVTNTKKIYEYICGRPQDHTMVKTMLYKFETETPALANKRLLSFLTTMGKKMIMDKYYFG